jgi:hypothetical protein
VIVRERLVSHPAILEAEWTGVVIVVRHWTRLVSAEDLHELVRRP